MACGAQLQKCDSGPFPDCPWSSKRGADPWAAVLDLTSSKPGLVWKSGCGHLGIGLALQPPGFLLSIPGGSMCLRTRSLCASSRLLPAGPAVLGISLYVCYSRAAKLARHGGGLSPSWRRRRRVKTSRQGIVVGSEMQPESSWQGLAPWLDSQLVLAKCPGMLQKRFTGGHHSTTGQEDLS